MNAKSPNTPTASTGLAPATTHNRSASLLATQLIVSAYAFLYAYTGINKLLKLSRFTESIAGSGLPDKLARLIGWGIPVLELLLACMLIIPKKQIQQLGLCISTALMGLFTVYIIANLIAVEDLMCSCGGAIESMSWKEHLAFNLCWMAAGIYALRQSKNKKQINYTS